MPQVIVTTANIFGADFNALKHELSLKLPAIVASTLSSESPACKLSMRDIELEFREGGELNPDAKQYNLKILVLANDSPERSRNLIDRRNALGNAIKGMFPRLSLSVWIRLATGSFGEY